MLQFLCLICSSPTVFFFQFFLNAIFNITFKNFRTVLDLQNFCEESINNSLIPHTQSLLLFNIIHQYGIFVTINELIFIHYHQTKSVFLDFPCFPLMPFFCFQYPIQDFIFHQQSCLSIESSWLREFVRLSLKVLRSTSQIFCGMSVWICFILFLIVNLRLWVFWSRSMR